MKTSVLVYATVLAVGIFFLSAFQQQKVDLEQSINRGKEIYIGNCISCHLDNGEGISSVFPPLAKSDYLMADNARAIKQVLYGARGEMVVNGKTYNMEMTGFNLSDQQVSDVLNYIRNSWGNKGVVITPTEVADQRKK